MHLYIISKHSDSVHRVSKRCLSMQRYIIFHEINNDIRKKMIVIIVFLHFHSFGSKMKKEVVLLGEERKKM